WSAGRRASRPRRAARSWSARRWPSWPACPRGRITRASGRPESLESGQVHVRRPALGGAGHDEGLVAAADLGALREDVVVGVLDLVEDRRADQPDERQLHAQVAAQLVQQRSTALVEGARARHLVADEVL